MQEQTTCVANIGPRGRQRRFRRGLVWMGVGAGAGAALALAGAPRWLRLASFGPFLLGAIGVFQAYEQTCVMLAARRTRNMDTGEEQITDQAIVRQVDRQARKVYIESALTAALLTAILLALPRKRARWTSASIAQQASI
jgi:hypothetical protein